MAAILDGELARPAHAIKCLKADGLNSVWLTQPPGQPLRTVKIWPLGPAMALKLLLGIAQPQRQIRGMRRLRRLGINTPANIGSWRIRRRGGRYAVELTLEYAPGQSAWEIASDAGDIQRPDDACLLHAARSIGRIVHILGQGGVFHRDLKLSNVVIDFATAKHPTIWLIDPVGVRAMRQRIREYGRMLERLAVQPLGFEPSLARRIRIAVLRSALRPLPAHDRRGVCRELRAMASLS